MKPNGFFRPQWSPDGKLIAFTSDRNTDWKGHSNNAGWEHLQELSIYIIQPDGNNFKRLTGAGVISVSPKWSKDGKEIIYCEMPVENSWLARGVSSSAKVSSQILSINLETGKRTILTAGSGLKLYPSQLPDGSLAYVTKAGLVNGIAYTKGSAEFPKNMRSPSWSPDGKKVVYEKIEYRPRPQNQLLYSWDADYEYRYTDVFPSFSVDGTLVVTNKDVDSSIVTMRANGSDKQLVFNARTGCTDNTDGPCSGTRGAAFAPSWSPDGEWLVFGYGGYFQARNTSIATIMMARRDGSDLQGLTDGTPNAGFPSFSADGKEIVYRSWSANEQGLRILNLESKKVRVLTTQLDNLPGWSVNNLIVFTRKSSDTNFDIYTIKPDHRKSS